MTCDDLPGCSDSPRANWGFSRPIENDSCSKWAVFLWCLEEGPWCSVSSFCLCWVMLRVKTAPYGQEPQDLNHMITEPLNGLPSFKFQFRGLSGCLLMFTWACYAKLILLGLQAREQLLWLTPPALKLPSLWHSHQSHETLHPEFSLRWNPKGLVGVTGLSSQNHQSLICNSVSSNHSLHIEITVKIHAVENQLLEKCRNLCQLKL